MRSDLESWVNYLASQLEGIVGAKDTVEAKYHTKVYFNAVNHLTVSRDNDKKELGYSAVNTFNLYTRNYDTLRKLIRKK